MSWTYIEDTYPRARKRYNCLLCGELILVGEKHVARRGFDDEGPCTSRMHIECERGTEDWTVDDWEHCGDTERPAVRLGMP